MWIIDLDASQIYNFLWSEKIAKYYKIKLSESYSDTVCNQMIRSVLNNIKHPKLYGELAIRLNKCYYILDGLSINRVNIEKLLPKINIDNKFLTNIFESYSWKDCILDVTSEKDCDLECEDIKIVEIVKDKIQCFWDSTELDVVKTILSPYLQGNVLNFALEQFKKLLSMDCSLPLHFIINKKHYFGYRISEDKLELRERKICVEDIEKILNEVFNNFSIAELQDIITQISNKIIFGIRENYLIRVTEWKNVKKYDDIMAIGVYYFCGKEYKFYNKCDRWYSTPVSKEFFRDNKDKFEEVRLYNSSFEEVSKELRKLGINYPIKLHGPYDTTCIYDGKIIKEIPREQRTNEYEEMVILKLKSDTY